MNYAITGATGHIGGKIAATLLSKGCQVRVIGRTAERLKGLVGKGATAWAGNLADVAFVRRAFAGVDAVFAMIPPDNQAVDFRACQTRVGGALAEAIKVAGVKYVVNLSSVGAHLPVGTGPIAGLHEQEERLNQIPGLNILHLRPTFFMENLMIGIGLIKTQGINGSALKGDLRFPVIATRDIASAASAELATPAFKGVSVKELLGPRDHTMEEMTKILGQAIGKPDLKYVQFSYEDTRQAMLGMGLSPDVARLYIEMYTAFNEGRITRGLMRTPANTTPTTFEEFAREFAAAYKA